MPRHEPASPLRVPPGHLIAVVGATATGKTAAGITVARAVGGEVVGADSRQVYAGMAIGTAQPASDDLAATPHHLIGFLPPGAPFGLAQYLDFAHDAIARIEARGRVPVIVGGTGQYVWALLERWTVPRVPPDHALRARYAALAETQGAGALHALLAARDPAAALRIHPNNVRRVIRALEVAEHSGQPISELQRRRPVRNATVIGLRLPRTQLYARIDERVRRMFREGLVEEVERLRAQGYRRDLPSMHSIGYPEVWALIEGELTLDQAIVRVQQATHRLARQQQTWFRPNDPRIHWVDAAGDVEEQLLALLREQFGC
ncbi:MAG TPA: tRNA (adenosine(37)-N6)-dimethylallyltransferase MiaA [Dehalococcoidia bacterium]|nr:tRNA (adenosine(37)-N6)-dimethylallyltransferase MiaA [Dehalococcoidia bacterium]